MFLAFLSYTRLSTSIWLTDGSVDWNSMATSPIIRLSPRTVTAGFVRAISCVIP